MEPLKEIKYLKVTVNNQSNLIITHLKGKGEISLGEQINHQGNTLLAYKANTGKYTYNNYYLQISPDGTRLVEYQEEAGLMPNFFYGADNKVWVAVSPYHPDKELDIFIPFMDRENFEPLKPSRPFLGDYIGNVQGMSLFYEIDGSTNKKPDKMLLLEYKDSKIKKKHTTKIPLRGNSASITRDTIQLLLDDGEGEILHREIDYKGNEIRRRTFTIGDCWVRVALNPDFESDTWLISDDEDGTITLITVTPAGEVSHKQLINIGCEITHMWNPVRITSDVYTIKFNSMQGPGWFTISKGQLIEFWISKQKNYQNLLVPEQIIELPFETTINNLTATSQNSYAISLSSDETHKNEFFIANRDILSILK